jgi:CheY-like chemotaxis protein
MQLKVVAVDDEPEVLQSVKTLLQALECEVTAFSDSQEAVEHLETHRIDGVFVDIAMPNLDGFEVARRVRASNVNAKVPIVMLTGLSDAETMKRGFEAGVTVAARKPVNLEGLRKVVTVVRTAVLREKRQYERVPYQTEVTCTAKDKRFLLRSIDVSERGMQLEGSTELAVGDDIDLTFHIPQQRQPMSTKAKVLRVIPPDRIGTGFINMTPQFRQALLKYLLQRR